MTFFVLQLEKLRSSSGKEQQQYADMVREAQDHVREANKYVNNESRESQCKVFATLKVPLETKHQFLLGLLFDGLSDLENT